jgi:hypothetical protein
MSAALRALTMHQRILATLASETTKRGIKDGEVAARIGCGREFVNRTKNRLMHGGLLMLCSWAVIAGLEIVACRSQDEVEGRCEQSA